MLKRYVILDQRIAPWDDLSPNERLGRLVVYLTADADPLIAALAGALREAANRPLLSWTAKEREENRNIRDQCLAALAMLEDVK
jgi:hypothetical protein